jgi:competence protein ComEC
MSCVLRVADGHKAALLAGDVERLQELSLVERQGAALQADWLLVPHHGSRTSSTARFLSAVQPRLALAQAGYRNRFGHPAHDVQARYLAAGITLHTSAACGAQRWPAEDSEANDAAATAQCERDRRARYWHHRPR